MKSKVLGIVLGVVAGGLLTLLLMRSGRTTLVDERDALRMQLVALSNHLSRVSQLAAIRNESETSRARMAERQADSLQALPPPVQAIVSDAKPLPELDPQRERGMEIMKQAAAEMSLEAKLLKIKNRMQLSPEQEASLREILKQEMDPKKRGNTKAELEAVLSPEQFATLEQMRQEKTEKRSRARAWQASVGGLNSLDATFGLTDEQQDKAFAALFQIEQTRPQDRSRAEAVLFFEEVMQRKIGAMKDVLTPEQFAIYQRYEEQMFEAMKLTLPRN